MNPDRINELRQKYNIQSDQGSTTPAQRDNSALIASLKSSWQLAEEQHSAETAGALFPAKTAESPVKAGLKALGNTPSSMFNMGRNIYQMVRHPIETAKGIGLATTGGLDTLLEKYTGLEGDPESMEVAKKVGGELQRRYGSLDALQRTATNDPFAFGTDILTLMTGLGPAAATMKGAEVANTARKVTAPIRGATAGAFERSAQKSIGKVLEPTKEANKIQTTKILPDLTKKTPMAMTRGSLEEKYAARAQEAGQEIDAYIDQLPDESKSFVVPVLEGLEKEKNKFIVKGTESNPDGPVIANPNAYQSANDLQDLILQVSDNGYAPTKSIRSIRQIWDEEIDASKGFTKDLKEGTMLNLKKQGTNAIREVLAEEHPDLAKLNKEYTLWKSAEDILRQTNLRKTGKEMSDTEKGALGIGGVGGGSMGGFKAAVIGAAVVGAITLAVRSTAWRTLSAATKLKIAEKIYEAKPAELNSILTQYGVLQGVDIEDGAGVFNSTKPVIGI